MYISYSSVVGNNEVRQDTEEEVERRVNGKWSGRPNCSSGLPPPRVATPRSRFNDLPNLHI